jgi:uncharacterized protein (TIGR00725 family)
MGASAADALQGHEEDRVRAAAEELGRALAESGCLLVTGATTGFPGLVARAYRGAGGFAVGISPGENRAEHVENYGLPEDGADIIIYTGFGLKGRNVVNVRSADIVIIVGGATGTLNEFTIAYDEAKIIGVLEGSGGIADRLREIIAFSNKPTRGLVIFEADPHRLVTACLKALNPA